MKKNIIVTVIFLLCLVLPVLTAPLADAVLNVEINENRQLREFPELTDNFISEFEEYFVDHAPYRDVSIKISSEIDRFFGKIYTSVVTAFGGAIYESKNNVLFGEDGWLFYLGDNSLDYYIGDNLPTEDELGEYLERIELVSEYFESKGKKFVILVPPNKENVYSEYMPFGIPVRNSDKRLDIICDYINENSDANFIYPIELFLEAKQTRRIYYKYDTHWNNAGAALGVREMLSAIGINCGEYQLTETERLGGDLTNMIAEEAELDTEFNVSFVDADYCATDKSLLLLGDSFRVATVDMLEGFFKETKNEHYFDFVPAERRTDIDNADVIAIIAIERYHGNVLGDGGLLDGIIEAYGLR